MRIDDNFATVNDRYQFLDAEPYIEGDYTLIPVRFIGESLGAEVEWNDDLQQVTYKDDLNTVVLTIGSTTAYVNGKPVEMPTAPRIKNEKTMVPLRFISEQLGANVEWDDGSRSITIIKE